MKTSVRIQPTFSADTNTLDFHLPTSWEELTQDQLRYITRIMFLFEPYTTVIVAFRKITGIHFIKSDKQGWHCSTKVGKRRINFMLSAEEVHGYVSQLKWLLSPGAQPVRLDTVGKYIAVDAELHGLPFGDYLVCENLYQGFIQTKSIDLLNQMAVMLYRGVDGDYASGIDCDNGESLSVFLWFAAVKNKFAKEFPYFYRSPGDGEELADESSMTQIMNAQIRALTGGDITKEQQVMDMDCWRALTELNEKAREAEEFRRKYGK
jgi:hypothetical protein